MSMAPESRQFTPNPVIGHPESWYRQRIEQAEAAGDTLARCAHKVGQYVTLGLDPSKTWEEKEKFFRHCLKHHCTAADDSDEPSKAFRLKMRNLVRRYASQEARRLARQEHDSYSMRMEMGVPMETLADEADVFFPKLLGHGSSHELLLPEAYEEISKMRNRWI